MTCPCETDQCAGKLPANVIQLVKEAGPVLFHRVDRPASLGDDIATPPETLDYRNVLLVYEANGHVYLYSSDGIPTFISYSKEEADLSQLLEAIQQLQSQLETEQDTRQAADMALSEELTAETNARTDAVAALNSDFDTLAARQTSDYNTLNDKLDITEEALSGSITALQNQSVVANLSVSGDTSTVNLLKERGTLGETEPTTEGMPLPVASETQAGVMNASTFQAIQKNAENIDSILNGAVLIEDLPATPSQDELTSQWKAATGKTTLINRASIYDKANGKIWYYYTNVSEWESADIQNPEVSVSVATNDSLGIVKGSNDVFIEPDGSMSVIGLDKLNSDLENLQSEMPKLPTGMIYDFVSPAGANNPSTADNANITARVVETATGNIASGTLMLPMASATQAGSITATDKAKLNNLLEIKSLGDGLSLSDEGVLSAEGGSNVNVLTTYNSSPAEGDAYDARYVNKRLDGEKTVYLGNKATSYSKPSTDGGGVAVGVEAKAVTSGVAIGAFAQTVTDTNSGENMAIGAYSISFDSRGVAIGAHAQCGTSAAYPPSYSVALGHYSVAKRDAEVSIGRNTNSTTSGPKTRFLANVTAGELDTDAVNLKQMNDAIAAAVPTLPIATAEEITAAWEAA